MADSIKAVVPPSVAFEGTGQARRDGQKKSHGGKGKETARHREAPNPSEAPAERDQDKGKHLDISA